MKELATRLALGAGRWRVGRQLVTESVLLTLVSAGIGLLVGYAALRLLGTLNIQELPRGEEIRLDGVVIAYTLAIAMVIGFVLGLIPVANVLPVNLTSVLREEGRGGTAGVGARALRRALVVAQVGFAFVLLVGAGLLFASFRQVMAVDPGFNVDGVLTASITLPRTRYPDDDKLRAFTDEALRRLRALPGVSAAGATDTIPLGNNNNDSVIIAEGYQMKPGESVISPSRVELSPGYFDAMSVKLLRGRFFDDRDAPKAQQAVIVDEKLAKRFWPNQDPIGRRMYLPQDINNLLAVNDKTVYLYVVGVIRDMKLHALTEDKQTVGAYYFPAAQSVPRGHDVRGQDRRRSDCAVEQRQRRAVRDRSRAAGLRHHDDGRADGEVAGQPEVAGAPVAQLRGGRALPVGDRHLRRAGLPRDAADQGDRHPHRARQQRPVDLRARAARGAGAHRRRLRPRRDRRGPAAQEPREPVVRRQHQRSVRAGRGHRRPCAGRGRGLRPAGAPRDPDRSDRRAGRVVAGPGGSAPGR